MLGARVALARAMFPRAFMALALCVVFFVLVAARPEAALAVSGPPRLGGQKTSDGRLVVATSLLVQPSSDHNDDVFQEINSSWYVRCHAKGSSGETRLAGTLPVIHAPNRTVATRVDLGDFALGEIKPDDKILDCAFYELAPNASEAKVSHAELAVARFSDADDHVAVLEFAKGQRSRRWITLTLRCANCVAEAVKLETATSFASSSSSSDEDEDPYHSLRGWRIACIVLSVVAVVEACALVALLRCTLRSAREDSTPTDRNKRVKRKTSDAPGVVAEVRKEQIDQFDRERRGGARAGYCFYEFAETV